ncbi:MAG: heme lyase CcmF/NrfE family subunit [Pseudomonadota bacterium]
MIPELGNYAIILAFCFVLIQAFAPLWAYARKLSAPSIYFQISTTAVIGQFVFLAVAMLCLILSFLTNDMSVLYVQEHSHGLLPFIYRVGAAWGGHEGSLLLWCLILSGWTLLFLLFSSKKIARSAFNKIILVLGLISAGFISFLLFTSDPFQRIFPQSPAVGDDLTPVLQDPGIIFHPPMLYMGYVGFAIAFAFAISTLIEGKFDKSWAKALRPWIVMPWSFLSCGIVLGSWWAYRELGWGGWWFWDPVENASLLPWLSATALLHALIVCEKREVFQGWTILLAIVTFTLSLLGTFLVRSGVLVSVHTFANDPKRGIYLLVYLAIIIGSALLCYGVRIKHFYKAPEFNLLSRETFLLINNVILITAVATITLGTLYPIVLDGLDLEKISIGEPYFNTVFLPIMLPLLLLMGFAPHVHWQQQSFAVLWKKLRLNLLLCISVGFSLPLLCGFPFHWLVSVAISAALWIIVATLHYVYQLWQTQQKIALQHWAMIIAHLGIAVLALGISVTKTYSEERQVKIAPHETVALAGYHFTLANITETSGANFKSVAAEFIVQKNNFSKILIAEQRSYTSHDQNLGKPGILANPWRDLYLALGAPLPDGAWSVRIYYKPFIRWIWVGGFMLLLGGLLSLANSIHPRKPS